MSAADRECPVRGGDFGTDFQAYQACGSCELQELCRKEHDRAARKRRQATKLPLYLQLPLGLTEDADLSANDRNVIALVWYRMGRFDQGYDKNTQIASLLGISPSQASRIVTSLVDRGYLVAEIQRLKRKRKDAGPGYRTSRKLGLGIKSVRLINRYRMEKDRLARVPEWC